MGRVLLRLLCKIISIGFLCSIFSYGVRADPLPKITAQSWLVADEQGNILFGNHTSDVRSIASITKLMTSMVVLDSNAPLFEPLSKKLYGRTVTRQELIYIAIVRSDNEAAKMLCDTYPTGYDSCIQVMNIKAKTLGMYQTMFVDSTGLHNDNVSTAEDLIKLVNAASNYSMIVSASNTDAIVWNYGKKQTRTFHNTNSLVGKGHDFIVTKTGFIRKAGGCIVMMVKTINGVRTVIVLGSRNTFTRIPEAHLLSTLR